MTDPLTQAEADAEQVRLVREALAHRRERPAGAGAPAPRVLLSFPGGPRPTLAEAGGRLRGIQTPATAAQPGPQEATVLYRRSRRMERGPEGAEPALR